VQQMVVFPTIGGLVLAVMALSVGVTPAEACESVPLGDDNYCFEANSGVTVHKGYVSRTLDGGRFAALGRPTGYLLDYRPQGSDSLWQPRSVLWELPSEVHVDSAQSQLFQLIHLRGPTLPEWQLAGLLLRTVGGNMTDANGLWDEALSACLESGAAEVADRPKQLNPASRYGIFCSAGRVVGFVSVPRAPSRSNSIHAYVAYPQDGFEFDFYFDANSPGEVPPLAELHRRSEAIEATLRSSKLN
jgi:hypothetical protein